MYCFIRFKHTEEGWGPDIPKGVGFLLLAEPGRGHEFALYWCCLPDDFKSSGSVTQVSDELADLLSSAEAYPPALAFTRKGLDTYETKSEIDFSNKLKERLIFHLQEQIHSPFFMAKPTKTQPGYKHAGGYYWIVGCKNRTVSWVSRDYFIYRDPFADFEFRADEIESRFGQKK